MTLNLPYKYIDYSTNKKLGKHCLICGATRSRNKRPPPSALRERCGQIMEKCVGCQTTFVIQNKIPPRLDEKLVGKD